MEPIILASSSPRRQDILKMLNIPFRVIMPNIDESFTVGIDASETAELLAREKIIAVQDRTKHNLPRYAYGVCKIFMLCSVIGGRFEENVETIGFDYFTEDNLPILADAKNTKEQIQMCFEAYRKGNAWKVMFD